ncbi:MAG: cutinase family protein, partial [Gordonia polyisoprenivorans]|nr:cutinase family protein [Gordonia polyisoprenivorans]
MIKNRVSALWVRLSTLVVTLVLVVVGVVIGGGTAPAVVTCPDVAVVMVPGTWETSTAANPNQSAGMLKQITDPIEKRFGDAVKVIYTNYIADAFRRVPYAQSKQNGIERTSSLLSQVTQQCSTTRFVLGGYSQGADVSGDLASDIGNGKGPISASSVLAVGLLADPSQGTQGEIAVGPRPTGAGIAGPRPQGMGQLSGRVATICAPGDLYCGVNAHRDGFLSSLGSVLTKSGGATTDATATQGASQVASSGESIATNLTSNLTPESLGALGDTTQGLTSAATASPGAGSINPTGIAQSATSLMQTLTPLADIAKTAATDPGLTRSLAAAPAGTPEQAASGVLSAASKIDLSGAANAAGQLAQTASAIGSSSLPTNSSQAQQLTSAAQGLTSQVAPLSGTPSDALSMASTVLSTLSPQVLVDQVLNVGTGVSTF